MQAPKTKGGKKKTTGEGTQVQVRLHHDVLDPLDAWIEAQGEVGLTRAEAIRRILRQALRAKSRRMPPAPKS